MYVFANEGPLIHVPARLLRGSDGPHGKCAGRKRTWGKPPRQVVIPLAEATEEWRRRREQTNPRT